MKEIIEITDAKSLAKALNGREYGEEITQEESATALRLGLVVVFGASDDLVEFRGAIEDEVDRYGGGVIHLHRGGILENHDDDNCDCKFCGYVTAAKMCATIRAVRGGADDYLWTYKTDLPHSTFEIMDGVRKYCRGIVFKLSDLPEIQNPAT